MCGIAAIVELRGASADRTALKRMTDSLFHRGPDDEGLYLDGAVGLGFRRLAIIDLSTASHQPMVSRDRSLVIIFNGEIYNYLELREELQGRGHVFQTSGDTEVLLHAYQEWGADCLPKLNGMWAFLIYDRRRQVIFGARDRFGVKPLYWYRDADRILFGSEIKAIRASGWYEDRINWATAASFLLSGVLNDSPHSFYEGIEEVPSGTMFELALNGNWLWRRYWTVSTSLQESPVDPVGTYATLFQDAVRLRMRSDVPVGVCLSGGLDSTAIICEMARLRDSSQVEGDSAIQAFCYMAQEYDESRYINETLVQTRSVLNCVDVSGLELWNSLDKVLRLHDEPVHSMNVVVAFELMRLAASKGIKVILNGQGADETAGGYSSYFIDYWTSLIRDGCIHAAWQEIDRYATSHKTSRFNLCREAGLKALATAFARWPLYQLLKPSIIPKRYPTQAWFDQEFIHAHKVLNEVSVPHSLTSVLRHSVERYPLPLYLRVEDRNSMGNSIETRLPFLDYRLVSFLFHLPDEYKLQGPWNKVIEREALRGRIPESIRTREDKMGFPVPEKRWMMDHLYEPISDVLRSQACRERGIYNVAAIMRDLDRHRRGEIDASFSLFFVAQFEVWNRNLSNIPLAQPVS